MQNLRKTLRQQSTAGAGARLLGPARPQAGLLVIPNYLDQRMAQKTKRRFFRLKIRDYLFRDELFEILL